jgi:hypothetical protein
MADHKSEMPEIRMLGHIIGLAAGGASLVGSVEALRHGMTPVLGITMLIIGVILPVVALLSLKYSRIAWSFLNSIMIVMALVTLFGSPKVRSMLHIPLGVALVIPFVLLVGIVALMVTANDYLATPSQKSQNPPR